MTSNRNILNNRILSLSDDDHLTFGDLVEGGTIITGGLGSGKSSTSGRALALGFLKAGMGGLVLTVKSNETAHWLDYAKYTNRQKDVIVFNAESGLSFDPLAYCWNIKGRGGAHIETIVSLFTTLLSVGKQHSGSSGERYFENAVEELMRAALVMLSLAKVPISIASIHKVISSLPEESDQIDDPKWQDSYCGRLVTQLRKGIDSFTPSQWEDLENALGFALIKWSVLDPRTKGNIESTWSGMASRFLYDPFRSLFCSGSYSFTPEQVTHERRIVILDMPVLEYGRESSRLCQILCKIVFQNAWLRHQYSPGCCNGGFLFQDELAMLMHKHENQFHMMCRGSAIAPVCLTPNILNIASEEFGEHTPGSKTKAFLGNLAVKIFHQQNDIETCNYASDQIGKEYKYLDGYSASGGREMHAGISGTKHLAHIIEPVEFTRLGKPNSENPCAEAIVYQSGKRFIADPERRNFLRVQFSREV